MTQPYSPILGFTKSTEHSTNISIKQGQSSIHAYHFRPLAGQRKKADLLLNHKALTTRCYEVTGMSTNARVISQESLQLSIF